MMTLLALVVGFVVFEALGYAFHRLLHAGALGGLTRAHMRHHDLYPPTDYLSIRYRYSGADSTTWRFLAVGVVLAGLMLVVLPVWLAVPLLVELAVVGLLNNFIHDGLHIRDHKLAPLNLYQRLRALHLQHHIDPKTNYGIFTFLTDRLLGTYKAPPHEERPYDRGFANRVKAGVAYCEQCGEEAEVTIGKLPLCGNCWVARTALDGWDDWS